jgi:hypothetical protein
MPDGPKHAEPTAPDDRVAAAYGAFAGRLARPLAEVIAESDEDERRAEERAGRSA